MLDIHTHILPNVDDGARSIEEAINMLKIEIEGGVKEVIFTPHSALKGFNSKEKLIASYNTLLDKIKEEKLNVKTYLGEEICYEKDITDKFKAGKLLTINDSKYVLVEFKGDYSYDEISEALYSIRLLGYKTILAHVEVYNLSTDEIIALKEDNNLIQMNASHIYKASLFKKAKIMKLIKTEVIDYIASDCHRIDYRSPNLDKVSKIIEKYPHLNINRFCKE